MRVKVTQDHIGNGVCLSAGACPVSLAMLDAGCLEVSADKRHIRWLTAADGAWSADTPEEASKFIDDFDNNRTVTPFEFDLEPRPISGRGGFRS